MATAYWPVCTAQFFKRQRRLSSCAGYQFSRDKDGYLAALAIRNKLFLTYNNDALQ